MFAMQSDLFSDTSTITVHQTKDWGEILTGLGRCNRFSIDLDGKTGALLAAEESAGWKRFMLGAMRPYVLVVQERGGKPVLRMRSAFRLVRREMTISASDGKVLGTVRKRFGLVHTRYDVLDSHGRAVFEIARGFLKPWTFTIRRGHLEVAAIRRRWLGIRHRSFARTQRFELQLPAVHSPTERALLLGALFLIDFQHFEATGGE
jgi:uncharacterized protein YxjI